MICRSGFSIALDGEGGIDWLKDTQTTGEKGDISIKGRPHKTLIDHHKPHTTYQVDISSSVPSFMFLNLT